MNLPLIEILYAAINAPVVPESGAGGITVTTNEPEKLRQRLYAEKRKYGDEFASISIMISRTNPDNELWIVSKCQTTDSKNTP